MTNVPTTGRQAIEASELSNRRRLRLIPLVIAALNMAVGFACGLSRLGLSIGPSIDSVAQLHGVFMIAGFLGTLISLERAVAFGRWWGYLAPGLSAAGAVTLFFEPRLAAVAFTLAGLVLCLASAQLALRQLALFSVTLVVAAFCWTVGTALWLAGFSLPDIVEWWLSFLILTIAAERLELSRVLRLSITSQFVFAVPVLLLLIGSARGELSSLRAPFTSAGYLLLAGWLLLHDVAGRTVRKSGHLRFSALAILAGHVWLGFTGLLLAVNSVSGLPLAYDAVVHAITIGVVLSMIFGHAPIILPAVLGVRVTTTGYSYIALAILHVSAFLRVTGDLGGLPDLRLVSAIATIAALIIYAAILITASWHGPAPRHPPNKTKFV